MLSLLQTTPGRGRCCPQVTPYYGIIFAVRITPDYNTTGNTIGLYQISRAGNTL